ncbi:tyrosine-type recombinase/integrase [Methanobrevibacter filiformis]|uniref:Phage integrase family protein n=1 Tax=Methanobrevibacter filiformis TaxID=55758 RepID=A0A165Z6Y3_9EURY|nr:tyrosine-type recombinase/integrase [Methanobrevibacter filiformis]KZX10324.1 phage integrase family protein [Methanobrevibacter filiformis]
MIENDRLIQRIIIRKNLSKHRVKSYKTIIKEIHEITNKTITKLINEAKEEQKPKIENTQIVIRDINDRQITQIYYKYYKYLKSKNKPSSIDQKLKTFRSFFNEYDVELPKNIRINIPQKLIRNGDIPDIEDIKKAVIHSKLRNKSILMLMATSGMRSGDIRNLKVVDFINATIKYHEYKDINEAIKVLSKIKEVIPCWEFIPQKTRKQGNICITFNTPETTKSILDYLKERKHLKNEDYLFTSTKTKNKEKKIRNTTLSAIFRDLNNNYFSGKSTESKSFFHAHALRKFFSTTFRTHCHDTIHQKIVMGHSLESKILESYQMINKEDLLKDYKKIILYLTINENLNNDKNFISIEQENILLKMKLESTHKQLNNLIREVKMLKSLIWVE